VSEEKEQGWRRGKSRSEPEERARGGESKKKQRKKRRFFLFFTRNLSLSLSLCARTLASSFSCALSLIFLAATSAFVRVSAVGSKGCTVNPRVSPIHEDFAFSVHRFTKTMVKTGVRVSTVPESWGRWSSAHWYQLRRAWHRRLHWRWRRWQHWCIRRRQSLSCGFLLISDRLFDGAAGGVLGGGGVHGCWRRRCWLAGAVYYGSASLLT